MAFFVRKCPECLLSLCRLTGHSGPLWWLGRMTPDYVVLQRICVSCLECPLLCLGGAGINLKLMTTPLPWRTVWPVWQLSCDVGERATQVCLLFPSASVFSAIHGLREGHSSLLFSSTRARAHGGVCVCVCVCVCFK